MYPDLVSKNCIHTLPKHTQHNTECGPHLPHHHQGATNISWSGLGGIDGNRSTLGTYSKPQQEPCDKQLLPCLWECLTKARDRADEARDQDDSSTVQQPIQRIIEPA